MKNIIKDIEVLRTVSEEVLVETSISSIIKELEESFDKDRAVGLSAIQIGIPKKIGIIRFDDKHKLDLINPVVIEKSNPIKFPDERCLSLPNISVNTVRYANILLENGFGENRKKFSAQGLEAIAIQHEVDHMNGILIIDRKEQPYVRESKKIGRNEPCPCNSGKKYKKCCGR